MMAKLFENVVIQFLFVPLSLSILSPVAHLLYALTASTIDSDTIATTGDCIS